MATTSKVGNASIKRAAQRVKDARSAGYKTTSKYTGDVQSGKTKELTPGTVSGVITSESIKPVNQIKLPEPTQTTVPDYTANNTGLTSAEYGVTTDGTNLKVEAPKDELSAIKDANLRHIENLIGLQEDRVSMADITRKLEKETGKKQIMQDISNYSAQINTITAQRDAQKLALEGQGRGQTGSFIGGEQARIDREAAIKALPVQAQLAAAQNNLELAQDHIQTWGNILMQDATNEYNNKKELYGAIRDYTVGVETMRLNKLEKENDRKYQEQQNNITTARQAAMQAMQNGQTGLMKSFTTLDPKSATFNADYNSLLAQLREPLATGAGKRDTQFDKDGNLIDMQTGEVIRMAGGTGVNEQQQTQMNETLTLARELLSDKTSGKSGAVGAAFQKFVPFGMSLGLQGDRASFENKVNTLKANLTLENLSLLKGPMSDKDLAFLQAIGSSLTTNMSEKSFNTEMKRIVNKIEERIATPAVGGTRIIVAPDGQQIEIID